MQTLKSFSWKVRFVGVGLFFPALALSASLLRAGNTFRDVILYVLGIISVLTPILFTLAFLVFFWGLSKFILSSGNETEVAKGKSYMLWGILALFILLTFKSIISLVSNDLELTTGGARESGSLLPTNIQSN